MAKWIDGFYSPANVIQRLDKHNKQKSSSDFRVISRSYDFNLLLGSMLNLNRSIPQSDKQQLVNKAVVKSRSIDGLTKDNFIKLVNVLEKEYLKQEKVKYRLISDVSVHPNCLIGGSQIENCNLRFSANLPKPFYKNRELVLRRAKSNLHVEGLPINYQFAMASVWARTEADAVDAALDAIDLRRSIWNLLLNYNSWRMSSGKRTPFNKILLGPVHTLHLDNGDLATEEFWYQPEYIGPQGAYHDCDAVSSLMKQERKLRGRLINLEYYDLIKDALIRYVRALDLSDWEDSFLRLWGVLELLTKSGREYKEAIHRAPFLFPDREFEKQILYHLKQYRHRFAHAGVGSDYSEQLVYQLKKYVEVLLMFHLTSSFRFDSYVKCVELMDIEYGLEELEWKKKLLRMAQKIIR